MKHDRSTDDDDDAGRRRPMRWRALPGGASGQRIRSRARKAPRRARAAADFRGRVRCSIWGFTVRGLLALKGCEIRDRQNRWRIATRATDSRSRSGPSRLPRFIDGQPGLRRRPERDAVPRSKTMSESRLRAGRGRWSGQHRILRPEARKQLLKGLPSQTSVSLAPRCDGAPPTRSG